MIENYDFFEINKKYKIIETFSYENYFFLPNEEIKFIGCQFIPYDGAWSYAFKNKKNEFKYFVIWDKEELKSYTKFFIKE